MSQSKICPKCGREYKWIERKEIKGNIYLYAVHVYKENGRRRIRKCYLGPKEHKREVVFNIERISDYLDELIKYLKTVNLDDGVRKDLGVKFMRIGRYLLKLDLDINEISELLWTKIHFAPSVYRRINKNVIEMSTPSREISKKICEVLEEYGYVCRISEDGFEVYVSEDI